jgi:hypothetical protein
MALIRESASLARAITFIGAVKVDIEEHLKMHREDNPSEAHPTASE